MNRRTVVFFIFITCCVLLLGISGIGIITRSSGIPIVSAIFSPLQKAVVNIFHGTSSASQLEKLKQENSALSQQLARMHLIEGDNKALRDQFQTTTPSPSTLLPAPIIGMPGFLPGAAIPNALIVSTGSKNGVLVGQAVVYKDELVGFVEKVNPYTAHIRLVTGSGVSFAVKTAKTGAVGIIKGQGDGQMVLDNVVLSDNLEVGDMVVTSPDVAANNTGFPPGLTIGKITSIDKKASNLFQSANVAVLVDVTRLPMVFVLTQK